MKVKMKMKDTKMTLDDAKKTEQGYRQQESSHEAPYLEKDQILSSADCREETTIRRKLQDIQVGEVT